MTDMPDNAMRRGCRYVLRVGASLASVDFYIRSMLRNKHSSYQERDEHTSVPSAASYGARAGLLHRTVAKVSCARTLCSVKVTRYMYTS